MSEMLTIQTQLSAEGMEEDLDRQDIIRDIFNKKLFWCRVSQRMLSYALLSCQTQDFDSEEAVKFPKAQPLDWPNCQKWDSLEAQYAHKSPSFDEFRIFELNDLWVIYRAASDQGVLTPWSDISKFHIDAASQDVIWISLHTI